MVTVQVVPTRVAMVHHRKAEAARAVTARVATSKADVVATRAVMVPWTAARHIIATTVAPAHAKTLVAEATADSKATARTTTAIVMRHAAATVTVIRNLTINQYRL